MQVHKQIREMWVRAQALKVGDWVVGMNANITDIRRGNVNPETAEVKGHVIVKFPRTLGKDYTKASYDPTTLVHVYR